MFSKIPTYYAEDGPDDIVMFWWLHLLFVETLNFNGTSLGRILRQNVCGPDYVPMKIRTTMGVAWVQMTVILLLVEGIEEVFSAVRSRHGFCFLILLGLQFSAISFM